jgi:hypothetical protein
VWVIWSPSLYIYFSFYSYAFHFSSMFKTFGILCSFLKCSHINLFCYLLIYLTVYLSLKCSKFFFLIHSLYLFSLICLQNSCQLLVYLYIFAPVHVSVPYVNVDIIFSLCL